jgi:hypothetical protein
VVPCFLAAALDVWASIPWHFPLVVAVAIVPSD